VEQWIEWVRGPAFRLAIALMVLGLLRLAILNVVGIVTVFVRARDKNIPWKMVIYDTARWFFPYRKIQSHVFFTVVSFLFHISIIVIPLFLSAHVTLWNRGLGVVWPSLDQNAADYLTLIAVCSALTLFLKRVSARATRELSRVQDYLLPLLIMIPFVSGYLAMHPFLNPFSYDSTIFVHIMFGNLIFILFPFSKLSHAVLFPTTQLVSEMAWHLDPESGRNVAITLGKEQELI